MNPLYFSNTFSLYIAYIEEGLIKIGSSDCRLKEREDKHLSCETLYPQFPFISIFPISSGIIESRIHTLLDKYRCCYQKQKEIYRPSMSLKEFVGMIKNLLEENDLKYQLDELRKLNYALQKENLQLKLELMEYKT